MRIIPLIASIGLVQTVLAEPINKIEVFHDDSIQVNGRQAVSVQSKIKHYNLSDKERFFSSLSEGLIVKPWLNKQEQLQEAREQVSERMASLGASFQPKLKKALEGHLQSVRYRIEYLPAIVINESKVIYGMNDIQKAIDFFKENEK